MFFWSSICYVISNVHVKFTISQDASADVIAHVLFTKQSWCTIVLITDMFCWFRGTEEGGAAIE